MKKKIFSIALLGFLSTLNAGVISQNGIAKDSATGLMWQDDNDVQTIKKDYNGAKAYCENLTLGGFSDWRLPNIYELTTLLDNTKSSQPRVLDGIANIVSVYYWSSTTYASDSRLAWGVVFYDGYDDWLDKTLSYNVRCVRAGQLNFDNLVILKNQGKVKVNQKVIDKISTKEEAKRKKEAEIAAKENAKKETERKKQEAQEQVQREKQAKIREEQKFQLGNSVCYSGHSSNSGWCGSIENIRGDKIQVEITRVNINGFAIQLNASDCTGNKDLKYHDEGKLIWVSKSCVD
jgi:hypothetical protein